MIRIADKNDVYILANMMLALYKELQPDHYTNILDVYIQEVRERLYDPRDVIYIDNDLRGFYIVRDETEPMAPTLKRYNGIRVYIYPEHRHSSLLARFYDRLWKDYPEGEILGVTEIDSEHIPVLDKRHTLIAKVYRLNRSQ